MSSDLTNGSNDPRCRFSDEEFLKLYNKGFSDYIIANALHVSETTTWRRRRKLKLLPHYLPRFQKGNTLNRGKKLSEDHKRKLGLVRKGRKPWNTGKHLTVEHKQKIGMANTGKYLGAKNPSFGKIRYPKPYFPYSLNHEVRSKWEEKVCRYFLGHDIAYSYESRTFHYTLNGKQRTYTPDLELSPNLYIEIKGVPLTREIQKLRAFKSQYQDVMLLLMTSRRYIPRFPTDCFTAIFDIEKLEDIIRWLGVNHDG